MTTLDTPQPTTPTALLQHLTRLAREHALATTRVKREHIEQHALTLEPHTRTHANSTELHYPHLTPACTITIPHQPRDPITITPPPNPTPAPATLHALRWYHDLLRTHHRLPTARAPYRAHTQPE